MKSMALMLRRLAFAGFAMVGACYSAGDSDGNEVGNGGGGSQCLGFAPLPCRCANGDDGFADCDDGVRGSCECSSSGGTGNTGNTGNTGALGGTGNTGNTGNTGGTIVEGGAAGEGGSGGVFVPECTPGVFEPCTCSIADGYVLCHFPGTWSECICDTIFAEGDEPSSAGGAGGAGAGEAGASAGGAGGSDSCTPVDETCDGADQDCDGVADDGYVCDDDTVHHIIAQTRGIYLQGTTNEGFCGYDVLQQFWPTVSSFYYDGFDCNAERYLFRRSDYEIFYSADGIFEDTNFGMDPDTARATAPCGQTVAPWFDFDADSDFLYQCSDAVYRNGAATPITGVTSIVAVLDDGRVVATQDAPSPLLSQYVVYDAGGTPLGVFPEQEAVLGSVSTNQQAVVVGNAAYFTLLREYQAEHEVMVFRLSESSDWQLVRRVAVEDPGSSVLASPEGTVLVRRVEAVSGVDEEIVAYMVDGSQFVVWSEADSTTVRADGGVQLLPGPLQ